MLSATNSMESGTIEEFIKMKMKKNCYIQKIAYLFDKEQNELLEKFRIGTKYETEPPHGDSIFSIFLKGKELPFWIYGRNIFIICETKVMVEAVAPNTWNQLYTVIIDLEKDRYAGFEKCYQDISFMGNQITLTDQSGNTKEIPGGFDALEWIAL